MTSTLRLFIITAIFSVVCNAAVYGQHRNTSANIKPSASAGARISMSVYEYDFVDVQPQFPGGSSAMIRFINNERRYPSTAYHNGVEGRVLCSFIVNTDGSISHIAVLRGVEESLNREAVRIISQMPNWEAGQLDGSNVPVYCILPIAFRK
jgi:TonB family C-terminal domain